ncbi:MAG: CHAT domain-containing protein [Sphingobacteriales bacterium]|nr:MAG: CHAT domain-containing protein [Sphingobacteriales bacterium]
MKHCLITFLCGLFLCPAFCQKGDIVPDVDSLIKKENYKEANRIIKERLQHFFAQKNIDTIADYINYLGKSAAKLSSPDAAVPAIEAVIQKLKIQAPYHKSIIPAYFEAAACLSNLGKNDVAYHYMQSLEKYFAPQPALLSKDLSALESNKGDYAMRQGKYALASSHYLRSIAILKTIPNPDQQKMYFANNSMGIVMWYSSRLDSAVLFFEKAVEALNKMENNPLNRNYRVALVESNMAGCYNVLGKTQQAIKTYERVIDNFKKFIQSPEPHAKKENALMSQFQTVDNLAKVYVDLGDFSKAHDLLYYAYKQKQQHFGDKSPEVYKSLIFLGTIYNNQRNYTKARSFLNDAVSRLQAGGDVNNAWGAEAYSQLAVAARGLKNNAEATHYFGEANKIYEIVYGGQYDDLYLNYLGEMSLFYADNKQPVLALSSINKGLNYVVKSQGEQSLQTVLQLRNLAAVHFSLKNYDATIKAAARGLTAINGFMGQSREMMDSVKIELEKPRLILLRSKAAYEKLPAQKDIAALSLLLKELYQAKDILDKRKTILFGDKDITALMANNNDLLDFIKKLNYELYNATGRATYLDKLIGLHEAGMYARIRSRMDKQKAIRFAKVPEAVIEEENKLKAALENSLKSQASHEEKITAYLTTVAKWRLHNENIRKQYPAYYNMRYAGIEKTLNELSSTIPTGITALRYFFTGKDLMVVLATAQKQKLYTLSNEKLEENIAVLNDPKATPAQMGQAGYTLYNQLWKPIEKEITTNRVMIIPDNILYNLSFDMLSPVVTNDFRQLASNCLLNKYAIAYHFSLLAVAPQQTKQNVKDNFVGFSPEFSDEQKKQYSASIKNDSLHLDNTYLSLLPLPFTTSLTKKIQNSLGGSVFLNNASTPASFRSNAGGHSIIHIGTHAESNNNFPEFSRLIFAKDPQKANAENAVYLFDIYSCDLSSNLAVLAACESGKPGYQDGEGMISMAHAFNYAGSESILTGLWKIDEQASANITDRFYKNLQEGMSKDEALRQAKLHYLQNNDGRLLNPQYWAGLVIMGDTSPVQLKPSFSKWIWIAGGVAAIALIVFFWNRKRKAQLN